MGITPFLASEHRVPLGTLPMNRSAPAARPRLLGQSALFEPRASSRIERR